MDLYFANFLNRTSWSRRGISNNEQGTSNVEGKYILHHSLFDIRYSMFKNYFLLESDRI